VTPVDSKRGFVTAGRGHETHYCGLWDAGCGGVDWLYFNSRNAIGAPNAVRIDTQSRGLLFTGQTVPQTMRAAAKATLDRGYTHFRFADASVQQGSVVTGTIESSSTNVVGSSTTNVSGNYGGGFMNANGTSFGSANATTFGSNSVIRAPTAGAAATVLMFHANEPGAQGAFDAEQVLKLYSS
jgi:hypothetical protein